MKKLFSVVGTDSGSVLLELTQVNNIIWKKLFSVVGTFKPAIVAAFQPIYILPFPRVI